MEKTPSKFIMRYLRIFKGYLLASLGLIIISQTLGQSAPYFMAKVYDTASGQVGSPTYWNDIVFYALIACAVVSGRMLFSQCVDFIIARFMPKANSMVVRDVFDYVNKHSIAYFSKEMSGNVSNKIHILAGSTKELMQQSFWASYSLITMVVSFVFLLIVNWLFLPIMTVWVLLVALVSFKLGKVRRKYAKETGRLESAASGMVVDSLSNYSEIKNFANFKFEKLNLLKSLRTLKRADTKERTVMAYIRLFQQSVNILSLFSFLFLSIYMLRMGILSTAQFIFVNTLFATLSHLVFEASWIYNNMARVFGNMSSALETLAVDPEIVDKPGAGKLDVKRATIKFENVSFQYENREPLFTDLSVEIKAGEKVGLVGLSGSGKSTFIKLISRYFDVNNGAIKINKYDIRDVTQDSLHKAIAAIPQDVSLFNRTLYDNIRYGKTMATEKEVHEAAKKAFADIFIKEFENGYKTKVGDRGVILSGGERQRIAIARAILKNAPILVFDEATSALDSQSERHIQKSLKNLMKGKTVIAIAHRLSTLREMDRILVFDKGRIVEQGSHAVLLRKKGVYQKLYTMQVDGFMGE